MLFDFVVFERCILLFTCATFWHHVALWAFAPFKHFSCGRPCSEFSKLEKNKNDNETNKKKKWKSLVSWMKRNNSNNKEMNKTMVGEELLEKNRQGENWTRWHQRKERPLETLTCNFQKLKTSLWEKDAQEP
jgi:hypothetical protein